jgi:membrane-associated phospholipid phosphatase
MTKPHSVVTPPARNLLAPHKLDAEKAVLSQRLFWASMLCLVLAGAALLVDLPVAYAFLGDAGPIWSAMRDAIHKFVRPAETFANGLGVLFLIVLMFAADVANRRGLLRMAAIVYGAGLWSNILKGTIARTRPRVFFNDETGHFAGGVLDSFQGWLPLHWLGYDGQSVPSGHTATAVALAIVLSRRWPHATWAFATIAFMSIVQRICYGHHYVSDCFAGAALSCLMAALMYHPRWMGRWFDWFETRPTAAAQTLQPATGRASTNPPPRNRRAA